MEHHELIMEGGREALRAFLAGVSVGSGWPWEIRFHSECGVREEGIGRRLLERLGLERDLTHVLVPASRATEISAACERARATAGLKLAVHEDRPVRAALLEYRFAIYQRELAERVRALLSQPPAGIELEDAEEAVEQNAGARGVEIYTPAHDYAFKGRGRARGPVLAILELRESLRALEPVELEPIQLEVASS